MWLNRILDTLKICRIRGGQLKLERGVLVLCHIRFLVVVAGREVAHRCRCPVKVHPPYWRLCTLIFVRVWFVVLSLRLN